MDDDFDDTHEDDEVLHDVVGVEVRAAAPNKLGADLDLAAFKADNVPEENCMARLAAHREAWASLSRSFRDSLDQLDADVVKDVGAWVRWQHAAYACEAAPLLPNHKIPLAWVYAAGMHSVDVGSSMRSLRKLPRDEVGHVAALTTQQVNARPSMAAVAAHIFAAIAGQAPPPGCSFAHVAGWLQAHPGAWAKAPPSTPPVPSGAQQPAATPDTRGAPSDAATPSTSTRRLRERPAAPPATAPRSAKRTWTGDVAGASPPLVVVLEDGEELKPDSLTHLVLALSEARAAGLPVCLVVGLATQPDLVLERLPVELKQRVLPHEYKLQSPNAVMGGLLRRLQVNGDIPALLLGPRLLDHLNDWFLNFDFAPSSFVSAVRLATLLHFQQQPASTLVPPFLRADWPAVRDALRQLPIASLRALHAECDGGCAPRVSTGAQAARRNRTAGRGRGAGQRDVAEAAVCQQLEALRARLLAWQAALRWVHAAAAAVRQHDSFQWRQLLVDASRPGHLEARSPAAASASAARSQLRGPGAHDVHDLCAAVRALPDERARELRSQLLELGDCAAGDADMDGLLERLRRSEGSDQAAPSGDPGPGSGAPAPESVHSPADGAAAAAADARAKKLAADMRTNKGAKAARRRTLTKFFEEAAATGPGRSSAAAASSGATRDAGVANVVAATLLDGAVALLTRAPSTLPCASFICCDLADEIAALLHPAPRKELHDVLVDPLRLLDAACPTAGDDCARCERASSRCERSAAAGPSARRRAPMPDTCVAYQQLVHYSGVADVGTWFAAFCSVRDVPLAVKPPAAKKKRKGSALAKRAQNRRKSVRCVAPEDADDTEQGEAEPVADEDADVQLDEAGVQALEDTAARFCQAVSELQNMGFIRPARSRTGHSVHRILYHPDAF